MKDFFSNPLRKEIALMLAVKLALLFLLWWFFFSTPIKNTLTENDLDRHVLHFSTPANAKEIRHDR